MSHPKKVDVILIGSGISSLTSAALLSKKGKSVLVLEQYNKAGGYLHCFSRFGERYDTGAHYTGALGDGQPFRVILEYLGVYEDRFFKKLDPNGFDVFHFPEFKVKMPEGYDAVVAHLSDLFPGEEKAIQNYFEKVRSVINHFPHYSFMDTDEPTLSSASLEVSLTSVVEPLTQNARLKSVFYAYCVLHGVDPEETPFGFHAIMLDSLIRGSYGLALGGDALAQKFVSVIEKNGGKVLLKKKVRELTIEDRQVKRVVTEDGSVYEAEWIISGIHPKATFGMIPTTDSGLTPAFQSRLKNLRESIGVFGIYATCKEKPPFPQNRNEYFFSTEVSSEMFKAEDPRVPPSVVFLTSPKRAEGEKNSGRYPISLHAAGPMEWFNPWKESKFGKRPKEYHDFKSTYSESIFAAVEKYYPGFRKNISQFTSSTALSTLHFNGSAEGSAYGLYHSIQNTGGRAIGPRTKILNLLLSGQNSLFPGLLGATVSALRTSGYIVGMKPVLHELNQWGKQR